MSEFTLRRRVNFYEVDQAGIVHFSNYYRYMEEAEYGLWRSAGISLEPAGDYAFPRVAASFDAWTSAHGVLNGGPSDQRSSSMPAQITARPPRPPRCPACLAWAAPLGS